MPDNVKMAGALSPIIREEANYIWLVLLIVMAVHAAVLAFITRLEKPQPMPETLPQPLMIALISLSRPSIAPAQLKPSIIPAQPAPIERQAPPKPKAKPKTAVKPKTTAKPNKLTKPQPSLEKAAAPSKQPLPPVAAFKPAPVSIAAPPKAESKSAIPAPSVYQAPDFNAAYLHNPPPHYPAVSRRLGEEGRVLLRVEVTEQGKAAAVVIHAGSGFSRLDKEALDAVKTWRFVPAKRDGREVSAIVIVPVKFSIEG
jgi:protein TonB